MRLRPFEQRRWGLRDHAILVCLSLILLILLLMTGLLAGLHAPAGPLAASIASIAPISMAAWVLSLFYRGFYRGLIRPLEALKQATKRIREGDLAYRLAADSRAVGELRELALAFNRMAEHLESLDQAKSEFLATVSHELKNPLAALKEGLALITRQGEGMDPLLRNKTFAACLIATKRLEWMINNMLEESRIRLQAGLYEFDLARPHEVAAAILTAADEVRPLAQRKNMRIHVADPLKLRAPFNREGIVQVFENLLLNAIKYGEPNSTIEVELEPSERLLKGSRQAGDPMPHVQMSVVNRGKPIPEKDLSRLFERFFRAANSGRKSGLGLGLHVVRRIIEAHQGEVAADSAGGQTRIQLWIPCAYHGGVGAGPG